jgi:hypothetical protein
VLVQIAAKGLEIGLPTRADHHDLAVKDSAYGFELRDGLTNRVEFLRPIEAAVGIGRHLAVTQVRLRTEAVPFDLVHPPGPCRGRFRLH